MSARIAPRLGLFAGLWALMLGLGACAPQPTPGLFIPPSDQTGSMQTDTPVPTRVLDTPTALPLPSAITPASAATATACNNDLTFVHDLTVPDGSIIPPGGNIDKQWLVQNSGTCNWNAAYQFKLIFGEALGASSEQALYPARAGTQVTLRVLFIAPLEAGTYQSAWQAFGADGAAFGDTVFMQIVVSP